MELVEGAAVGGEADPPEEGGEEPGGGADVEEGVAEHAVVVEDAVRDEGDDSGPGTEADEVDDEEVDGADLGAHFVGGQLLERGGGDAEHGGLEEEAGDQEEHGKFRGGHEGEEEDGGEGED